MRHAAITIAILLAVATLAVSQRRGRTAELPLPPPAAHSPVEEKILSVLNEMRESRGTYLSVPPADGRLLRILTEAVGAKHVVEIGTSTGYSGLWFCLALKATGGRLTTFELDPGRAAKARENFRKAGVEDIVTVVEGDAHANVAKLKGPIDVVFIDADKEGYVDYLNKLLPLVRPGGLILAHNIRMRAVAEGYLRKVAKNPELETVYYLQGGGLSVTLKKR